MRGPSLIIAYSHCIAHGIDMTTAMRHQKTAVDSGHWLLYRYHPDRTANGENPLHLDSPAPRIPLKQYLYRENRFSMLAKSDPDTAKRLLQDAQADVDERWKFYDYLASQ